MKAYHGSPKIGLKKLTFEVHNSRFLENLAQGQGIYLTEDVEVATVYAMGGSVYHVEVNSPLLDATQPQIFEEILSQASAHFGFPVNLNKIPYISETIQAVLSGDSSISAFGNSIKIILDNDESVIKFIEENGGYEITQVIAEFIQEQINSFAGYKYLDRGIKNSQSIVYIILDHECLEIVKEIKI